MEYISVNDLKEWMQDEDPSFSVDSLSEWDYYEGKKAVLDDLNYWLEHRTASTDTICKNTIFEPGLRSKCNVLDESIPDRELREELKEIVIKQRCLCTNYGDLLLLNPIAEKLGLDFLSNIHEVPEQVVIESE